MLVFRQLWNMIPSNQHLSAILLLGLMLVGMLLEMLGIGLVIPTLGFMTQNNLAEEYPILEPILELLGNPSQERLVVIAMATLAGVYTFKAVFLIFLSWRQAHFVSIFQSKLSQSLFSGYLNLPYTFHLQRNSAQLLRNIISNVGAISGAIRNFFTLMMEMLVTIGISILLITVEPVGAVLVVGGISITGWGIYRITKKYSYQLGQASQHHEGFRIQYVQQGLGGVKDVKLLGRQQDFIDQYGIHNIGSANIIKYQNVMQTLPRQSLELLFVIGLAGLVVIMLNDGKPLSSFLPIMGVFAASAFRFMPSVNRVLVAMQAMRFSSPAISTINDELKLFEEKKPQEVAGEILLKDNLTLEKVSFQYPASESLALQDIDISIPVGSSIGFIGSSGAGKSTLVDIILGLLKPYRGEVKVDGKGIMKNLRAWQDNIGYVPQSIYLTDDTLRRNIAFGLPVEQISEEAVTQAVHAAQLESFVKELPQGLDTMVGEHGIRLSGGQRQRIGIARALYHDPAVLVLDEATSSLDMETERGIMEAVCSLQGNKTILIVAHRITTVEHCDYLYRIDKGKVAEKGKPSVVLGNYVEKAPS